MAQRLLISTIEQLVEKIKKYQDRRSRIGEQNTKSSLITPMLEALGWDVRDPDEVSHEFKSKSQDSPVDYALCLYQQPMLLIEAKGLGESLDDRKWVAQVLGYATVVGVEWCILTDGNEYRVYNSAAAMNADDKLFCKIKLIDTPLAESATILSLISKSSLVPSAESLRVFWQTQIVDRRVRDCLRTLVNKPDKQLIALLKSKIADLRAVDITQSLLRLEPRFHSPVLPSKSQRIQRDEPSKLKLKLLPKAQNVTMKDILDGGIISVSTRLFREYKGHDLEAVVQLDGSIVFGDQVFDSPSTAAAYARATVAGNRINTNGWEFWKTTLSEGEVILDYCRKKYLKLKGRKLA